MNFCRFRLMRTVLFCCAITSVVYITSTQLRSGVKMYGSFSDTYQDQSVRSYFESYVTEIIEKGQMKSKKGKYIDGRNLAAVVHQYRKLLKKLATSDSNNSLSSINPDEINLLPQNILNGEQFNVMLHRTIRLREACMSKNQEMSTSMDPLRLLQEKEHHLIICRNLQAGSTTLSMYANVLHMYSVLNNYLTVLHGITDHYLLRSYSFPKFTKKDERRVSIVDNLSFVTVRHPFQRTISGYIKNILLTDRYQNTMPSLYSDMLMYSYSSPRHAKSFLMSQLAKNGTTSFLVYNLTCPSKVLTLNESEFEETLLDKQKPLKPTFRGYVLGVVSTILACNGRPDCLLLIESHYRSQTIQCNPCDVNYDAIVKTESLAEDIQFIERVLGLPPAYNVLKKVLTRNRDNIEYSNLVTNISIESKARQKRNVDEEVIVTQSNYTYPEFISQLTEYELNLIYTAYYNDFNVFSYDPCTGLV